MTNKDYKVLQMVYLYHLYGCKSSKDLIRLIIIKGLRYSKEEFQMFQELRKNHFKEI